MISQPIEQSGQKAILGAFPIGRPRFLLTFHFQPAKPCRVSYINCVPLIVTFRGFGIVQSTSDGGQLPRRIPSFIPLSEGINCSRHPLLLVPTAPYRLRACRYQFRLDHPLTRPACHCAMHATAVRAKHVLCILRLQEHALFVAARRLHTLRGPCKWIH